MSKEKELADLKARVEQEIDEINITALDDISEEISKFLDKWDPDGKLSEDLILETAASLGSCIEDFSSDFEYLLDAIQDAENAIDSA